MKLFCASSLALVALVHTTLIAAMPQDANDAAGKNEGVKSQDGPTADEPDLIEEMAKDVKEIKKGVKTLLGQIKKKKKNGKNNVGASGG